MQTENMSTEHDFRNAFILGLIIAIFLEPLLLDLGLAATHPIIYILVIIVMPALAMLGLQIAKWLFSRIPVLWQFSKFGLVGVGNTVINFGVLNLLVYISNITTGIWIYCFSAIAFFASLINSYIWNSHWSFKNNNPRTTKEFITFALITFIGLIINIIIVGWLANHSPLSLERQKIWVNIANLIATLCAMLWNFNGFKFIVFKEENKTGQQTA